MSDNDSCPFSLSFFEDTSFVAVMEVYSDASMVQGHFSIGSLLFRKKNIRPFNKKWKAMLQKHGLTHFHMTDCNAGRGPFKGKSRDECDASAREAIAILLEFATKGSIFSVKESDFHEIIGKRGLMPNPFTLGAWATIFDIRNWAEKNDPAARITYAFEAGDEHQKDVGALFKGLRENPARCAAARYRTHAFVPKMDSYPSQAADILAWHGAKHEHRRERDQAAFRLRGDFNEIVTRLYVTNIHHSREWLRHLVEIADKHMLGGEIAGLAFRMNKDNQDRIIRRLSEILLSDPQGSKKAETILRLAGE